MANVSVCHLQESSKVIVYTWCTIQYSHKHWHMLPIFSNITWGKRKRVVSHYKAQLVHEDKRVFPIWQSNFSQLTNAQNYRRQAKNMDQFKEVIHSFPLFVLCFVFCQEWVKYKDYYSVLRRILMVNKLLNWTEINFTLWSLKILRPKSMSWLCSVKV